MNPADFHQFYQKTTAERQTILQQNGLLTAEQLKTLTTPSALSESTANAMIENTIGTYSLPLGVATQFLIDGVPYIVPMAIEEPSVIAAASNGARMAQSGGGFTTEILSRQMIGEIAFTMVDRITLPLLIDWIDRHQTDLLTIANQAHPSLVKRGGGARKIWHNAFPTMAEAEFLVIYLSVDTKEAMGANMMNTMLEAVKTAITAQFAHEFPDSAPEPLMAILSNYATASVAKATTAIPFSALAKDGSGEKVATRIAKASRLALFDPYRAATHNKGIMNGVDAVVMASGNDWRAIEAGAHAYATRNGHYQSLSTWQVDVRKQQLIGTLALPLPVGTVGGSIAIHPTAQIAQALLQHPDAKQLMRIIASVSLAQNLAALKALVTEGIQQGHMALQARSQALQAGATQTEVDQVVNQLVDTHDFSLKNATTILAKLRQVKD
ncbi:MAG: hydroxymethylglutaryl-CoA reductase, degradative [Aerococcus sp.]|nr:hydroxymethylglutaryl-CoA reductase, degradative [Aerococcus sp.]